MQGNPMRDMRMTKSAVREAPGDYRAASLPEDKEAVQQMIQEVFDIIERKLTDTKPPTPAVVLPFKRPISQPRTTRALR